MTLTYRRDFLKLGAVATAGLLVNSATQSVWADTNGIGVLVPGGKGPRSGLPWHSGGFGNGIAFEAWRGRPFDVFTSFITYNTWAHMQGFPGNTSFKTFAQKPAWLSLAWPWLPQDLGDTVFTSFWDEAAEENPALQTPAAQKFWARHRQILDQTAALLNTKKADRVTPLYPYRGLILRVAWEFNGSSYCKMTDYTKCPQYRTIFQRFVTEARARFPNVVIEWNPLRKGTEGANFAAIYPGDEFVDMISICHYDRMPSFDSQQIWDEQAVRRYVKTKTTYTYVIDPVTHKKVKVPHVETLWDNPWGIETWANFAVQHNKKFGVPEWGLTNGWSYTDNCQDRDNTLYMALMTKFFNDHASILGYESYFNSATRHMIYPPGQVPYDPALEKDAAGHVCTTPSLNWPSDGGTGRLTSVNDQAANAYKYWIDYYYRQANPVA